MKDLHELRAAIVAARPLLRADRHEVLDAFGRMLDVAEHNPPMAEAWLQRMGPSFAAAGPLATVRAGLAEELRCAAMDAADLAAVRLMRPPRRRAS